MLPPLVVILMGVSGVGKTAVGQRVAEHFGWAFADADDFHPPEHVAKMKRGEGLTDADRAPWLQALRAFIEDRLAAGAPTVLACSALKATYREQLRRNDERVAFVWLDAPRTVIAERLAQRRGHFAGVDLLASQLRTLEPPSASEVVRIDARGSAAAVARNVLVALSKRGG